MANNVNPFTPPPEMVEAAARAICPHFPTMDGEPCPYRDEPRKCNAENCGPFKAARAAIAVLAPMIAEECAKEADEVATIVRNSATELSQVPAFREVIAAHRTSMAKIAAHIGERIRSKFATGEKGK